MSERLTILVKRSDLAAAIERLEAFAESMVERGLAEHGEPDRATLRLLIERLRANERANGGDE